MSLNYSSPREKPYNVQKTLLNPTECQGIGVHSGQQANLIILPAQENQGIQFQRTDVKNGANISALWTAVSATEYCTRLSNQENISVTTIEHLMAALAIMEIDNALIQVDGPEIPIMDGSAEPFINLMAEAGIHEQNSPRRTLRILKEVSVEGKNNSWVSLKPSAKFALDFKIDFNGREGMSVQQLLFSGSTTRMREEISRARTYGFFEDVEQLRAAGLAQGGSLDNAVVINQGEIMNDGGLRYHDECVRHKILDAIGDLYLAGAPICGFYQAYNGGHGLNNKLLHALMADETAWTWDDNTQKTLNLWQPHTPDSYEPQASFG